MVGYLCQYCSCVSLAFKPGSLMFIASLYQRFHIKICGTLLHRQVHICHLCVANFHSFHIRQIFLYTSLLCVIVFLHRHVCGKYYCYSGFYVLYFLLYTYIAFFGQLLLLFTSLIKLSLEALSVGVCLCESVQLGRVINLPPLVQNKVQPFLYHIGIQAP